MIPTPYVPRLIAHRLERLFSQFACVVILGARQVGKSTLLKNLFPEFNTVVFDPVQDIQNARRDPDLFLAHHQAPLILDEIQYAPELIPALKRHIDQNKKPGQYLLTGSQQWGVIRAVAESLAGRAVILDLEGFSLAEIGQCQPAKPWLERWLDDPNTFVKTQNKRIPLPYSLYECLWRGSLPEASFLDLPFIPDFQASYQRTYLERDIRLIADIADLQQFGRFVRLSAALSAQEINYSELGRDIGISPQTAKRWLNLLTQSFEWFEIPAWSNSAVKKVSLKPKGYFADTGQICFSQMISSPTAIAAHPLWGALFENAVVSELRKQASLIPTPPRFYHWRTHSSAEVDLILERDGKLYPIEIKGKTQVSAKDAKGIHAFVKAHPHAIIQPSLIVAPVETLYPVTPTDFVIPWDTQ